MQSKAHSILEAGLNTLFGYVLGLATQVVVFWIFDIHVSVAENLGITAIFSGVSMVRSYTIRRFFNTHGKE